MKINDKIDNEKKKKKPSSYLTVANCIRLKLYQKPKIMIDN